MGLDTSNEIILDALKEVANIGAGSAATSLAEMMSKKVDMDVPDVRVLEFHEVPQILGGEEKEIIGIYFKINEDINGNLMFALDINSALNLSNIIYQREREGTILDDMDYSVLSEVGNILASSYVTSLSSLTGLKINISTPSVARDMAGAILSVPAIQYGMIADKAIMIETIFKQGMKEVAGNFFLLPDLESFSKVLTILGVM